MRESRSLLCAPKALLWSLMAIGMLQEEACAFLLLYPSASMVPPSMPLAAPRSGSDCRAVRCMRSLRMTTSSGSGGGGSDGDEDAEGERQRKEAFEKIKKRMSDCSLPFCPIIPRISLPLLPFPTHHHSDISHPRHEMKGEGNRRQSYPQSISPPSESSIISSAPTKATTGRAGKGLPRPSWRRGRVWRGSETCEPRHPRWTPWG